MRLIDADALMLEPKQGVMNGVLFVGGRGGKTLAQVQNALRVMIDNAPTIEAEPVRRGRWEWYEEWSEIPGEPAECEEAGWRCSECKINLALYIMANTDEIIYIDDSDKMPTLERCPKCGAKMDKEKARE